MEQSKHNTSHFQIKHKISLGVEVVSISRYQSRESISHPKREGYCSRERTPQEEVMDRIRNLCYYSFSS